MKKNSSFFIGFNKEASLRSSVKMQDQPGGLNSLKTTLFGKKKVSKVPELPKVKSL